MFQGNNKQNVSDKEKGTNLLVPELKHHTLSQLLALQQLLAMDKEKRRGKEINALSRHKQKKREHIYSHQIVS